MSMMRKMTIKVKNMIFESEIVKNIAVAGKLPGYLLSEKSCEDLMACEDLKSFEDPWDFS